MSIWDVVAAQPWAITEPYLRAILAIAARDGDGIDAVSTRLGRPLANTYAVEMRDGVATIPVHGPIFRRANLFTEVSGATSIELLARDFAAAVDDPAVRGIVLDIDSPGGAVNGVNEFADQIYAARGAKPIVARVGYLAASAAYWIASAADEIVIDETAVLGSIGVVATVPDPANRKAKDIEIVSSQSPKKRLDVATPEGRRAIQEEVDALAETFIGRVMRNRDRKLEGIADGGMMLGQAAIDAGLADRVGSHESVIAELAVRQSMSRYGIVRSASRSAANMESDEMKNTLKDRILALFSDEAEPVTAESHAAAEPLIDAPPVPDAGAALNDLTAEIERLRGELDAAKAAGETIAAKERSKRIEAEVSATLAKYNATLGRDSLAALEVLLREVKAGSATESSLLAFVGALPPGGVGVPRGRTAVANVDIEAVADEATGDMDEDARKDAEITALMKAEGIKDYARALALINERKAARNG